MQIASAFGQVQDSLSFIVSSYTEIAQYQAVVQRLSGFRARMDEIAAEREPAAADRDRTRRQRRRGRGTRSRSAGWASLATRYRACRRPGEPAADHRPVRGRQEHLAARGRRAVAVRARSDPGRRAQHPVSAAAALSAARHLGRRARLSRAPLPSCRAMASPMRCARSGCRICRAARRGGELGAAAFDRRAAAARLCAGAAGAPGDRVSRRGDIGTRRGGGDVALSAVARSLVASDDRQRRPSRQPCGAITTRLSIWRSSRSRAPPSDEPRSAPTEVAMTMADGPGRRSTARCPSRQARRAEGARDRSLPLRLHPHR